MKRVIAIFLVISILILTACKPVESSTPTEANEESARTFVQNVLTMPHAGIAEAYTFTDPEEFNQEDFVNAVLSLCDGYAADEMARGEVYGAFYNEVIMFHIVATTFEYTCVVTNVELEETSTENQYNYIATVECSYAEEPIMFYGTIRLNEEGLVEYMSLNSPHYYDPELEEWLEQAS